MKIIFNYFFRGLFFVLPIFATFNILAVIANWADNTLNPADAMKFAVSAGVTQIEN